MPEQEKYLLDFLYSKYHKMELSKKETAEIMNISVVTLDRLRNKGLGPSYKKLSGTVKYPLHEVAKYLTNSNIKTS